jgi:hypothetical protein
MRLLPQAPLRCDNVSAALHRPPELYLGRLTRKQPAKNARRLREGCSIKKHHGRRAVKQNISRANVAAPLHFNEASRQEISYG